MNNDQIAQLWAQMERSITGMAVDVGRGLGVPVDNLLSYLNEQFVISCKRFDPDKATGSAEQFVGYQMKMRCLDFKRMQERKKRQFFDSEVDPGSGLIPEKSNYNFLALLQESLETADARKMLDLVMSMPEHPVAHRRSNSDKLEIAVREAQDYLEWGEKRIAGALSEIRSSYQRAMTML